MRRLSIICAEEAGRNGAQGCAFGGGGLLLKKPETNNSYTKWTCKEFLSQKTKQFLGNIYDLKPHFEKCSQLVILPQPNRAPENGWLGDDPFLLWPSAYFQGLC